MVARLVVVPTPIGNLEDITLRALRELRSAAVVLAEDTRQTRKLFNHFGIGTRLLSYHQHNKRSRLGEAMAALQEGDVALVSDAGTPSLADPGFELIQAAIAAGVDVDVLPGPSALVTAVVVAALPAPGFLFLGYLPRRAGERRRGLELVATLPYALVFYEAPHRLVATLLDAEEVLGDRRAVVARELTKIHQEIVRGSLGEMRARFEAEPPRGEITLVIAPAQSDGSPSREDVAIEVRRRIAAGASSRQAIPEIAARFGARRNEVYRMWIDISAESPSGAPAPARMPDQH